MDHGEPHQRSQTTRVSLHVVSVPEESPHPPVIKSTNLHVKITENDEVGFLVAVIQAEDPDGDLLWYQIIGKLTSITIDMKFLILVKDC